MAMQVRHPLNFHLQVFFISSEQIYLVESHLSIHFDSNFKAIILLRSYCRMCYISNIYQKGGTR